MVWLFFEAIGYRCHCLFSHCRLRLENKQMALSTTRLWSRVCSVRGWCLNLDWVFILFMLCVRNRIRYIFNAPLYRGSWMCSVYDAHSHNRLFAHCTLECYYVCISGSFISVANPAVHVVSQWSMEDLLQSFRWVQIGSWTNPKTSNIQFHFDSIFVYYDCDSGAIYQPEKRNALTHIWNFASVQHSCQRVKAFSALWQFAEIYEQWTQINFDISPLRTKRDRWHTNFLYKRNSFSPSTCAKV